MRAYLRHGFLLLLIAIFGVCVVRWNWLLPLDRLIYDRFMYWQSPAVPEDIVIVAIDDRSIQALGRWPWSRSYHATLLDRLTEANSLAVVFDVIFIDKDPAYADDDALFAKAISDSNKVALPVIFEQIQHEGQVLERMPLAEFAYASGILGHVHIERDEDGVSRALFLQEGVGQAYWPHISLSLLEAIEGRSIERVGVSSENLSTGTSPMLIVRNYYNLIPFFRNSGSVTTLSYIDVLNGNFPQSFLEDKIIFVGMTATGLGDMFATPVGRMNGVEINVDIFQALRTKAFISPSSHVTHQLLTGVIIFVLIALLSMLSPRRFLIYTWAVLAAVLLTCFAALSIGRYWFAPSGVVAAIILFYPFWSWQRLEKALGFLQFELKTIARMYRAKKVHLVDRVIAALPFIEIQYPEINWRILNLDTNEAVAKSGDDLELWARLSEQDDLKPQQLSKRQFRSKSTSFELQVYRSEKPAPKLEDQLDRCIMRSVDASRARHYGVEVVEQTVLDLKNASDSAWRAQLLIQKSIDQLPEAIMICDLSGRLLNFNQKAKQNFNVSPESSRNISSPLLDLRTSSDFSWSESLHKLATEGLAITTEVVQPQSERIFVCQAQRLALASEQDQVLVFSFTEITTLRAIERARLNTLQFLSHDMRSPMTSVLALIEKARYEVDNGSIGRDGVDKTSFENILKQIESYVEKNLSYADKFLHLAKAEDSQREDFELSNLSDIVANAAEQMYPLAQHKGINIRVHGTEQDFVIRCNAELIERAISNLLSNAIKFSEQGSEVDLSCQRLGGAGDVVQLSVRDHGVGIHDDLLPKLFERFETIKQGNPGGMGLGLAFVHLVVERHGGTINVSSVFGRGTEFTITFPLLVEVDSLE